MLGTDHFKRPEFACRCGCGQDTVDSELLYVLKQLRRHYGASVQITSANRCIEYNRKIGSKDTSQHVKSRAADVMVMGSKPLDVFDYLSQQYPDSLGLGLYSWGVHIDTRGGMARWHGK